MKREKLESVLTVAEKVVEVARIALPAIRGIIVAIFDGNEE